MKRYQLTTDKGRRITWAPTKREAVARARRHGLKVMQAAVASYIEDDSSIMNTQTQQQEGNMEHQAIEITGGDGKTHFVWADSAADAYQQATRWGYRHGGFTSVTLLIPQDEKEGCWERARRIEFGRQCDLARIVLRATCPMCAEPNGPSHDGSPACESGSIASGGKRAHCTCDACW